MEKNRDNGSKKKVQNLFFCYHAFFQIKQCGGQA